MIQKILNVAEIGDRHQVALLYFRDFNIHAAIRRLSPISVEKLDYKDLTGCPTSRS
jgi:hypothetical protein